MMRTMIVIGGALMCCACSGEGAPSGQPGDTDTEASTGDSGDTSAESGSTSTSDGSSEESTTSSGDESSSTTGVDTPGCSDPLPVGSPPALVMDGYDIVPIDVQSIAAELRFDVATASASATATMRFAMGPEGGLPSFDLRQTIETATLDGRPMNADEFPFFDPGSGADSRLRAALATLEPCTEHELVLTYALDAPAAPNAEAPRFATDRVYFHVDLTDSFPGRYLEQWVPAPLHHDVFELELQLAVDGTNEPHALVTNGRATADESNAWSIVYDEPLRSSGPLLAIHPTAELQSSSTEVSLPDGHTIVLDVFVDIDSIDSLETYATAIEAALLSTNLELGEYVHGDRYVYFYRYDEDSGMEYDGAGIGPRFAVEHEVFHAWVARGLRPLTGRDAWFDEAWTTFYIEGAFVADPLPLDGGPVSLAPDTPWLRETPFMAYHVGPRVFATVAQEIGIDELRAVLRDIYLRHPDEGITTETLEHELYCGTQTEVVRTLFHRYVYGRDDATPVSDLPDCPE